MKAIVRLITLYFTATILARWLTRISVAIFVAALGALVWMMLAARWSSDDPRAIYILNSHAAKAIAAVAVAFCGLFLASTLMPAMLAKQANGTQVSVLPYGKEKLLASAVMTVLIVALPIALALPLMVGIVSPKAALAQLFLRAYVLTCLNLTLLYFAYWLASTRRTAVGRLAGSMIVLAIILGPSGGKYLTDAAASLTGPATALLTAWIAFAALYLRSGDVHAFIVAYVAPLGSSAGRRIHTVERMPRIDLLLGTSRPWQLALIQIVPVLVATRFVRSPQTWLFYLTLFSAVSGAFASTAAARARALWLRTEWTRRDLFRCVERSFLRHNCYALGLLVVLLVAVGSYLDLSIRLLAYGLPLLVLGAAVSTYLGLMMTRRLGWLEIVSTVATMGLLMLAALLAAQDQGGARWLVLVECALAVLVVTFRRTAMMRWRDLDWMECRRSFRTKLRAG